MNREAIGEIANRPGAGADCPAGHLTDFAPQRGVSKAVHDFAGVLPTGLIPAVLAPIAPAASGSFAVDAIAHPAVPQAAMTDDMLEMVRNA